VCVSLAMLPYTRLVFTCWFGYAESLQVMSNEKGKRSYSAVLIFYTQTCAAREYISELK